MSPYIQHFAFDSIALRNGGSHSSSVGGFQAPPNPGRELSESPEALSHLQGFVSEVPREALATWNVNKHLQLIRMHRQDAKPVCLRLSSASSDCSVLTLITWRELVELVLKFARKKKLN